MSTATSNFCNTCMQMFPPKIPNIKNPLNPMYAQMTLPRRYLNKRKSANVIAVTNPTNTAAFMTLPLNLLNPESVSYASNRENLSVSPRPRASSSSASSSSSLARSVSRANTPAVGNHPPPRSRASASSHPSSRSRETIDAPSPCTPRTRRFRSRPLATRRLEAASPTTRSAPWRWTPGRRRHPRRARSSISARDRRSRPRPRARGGATAWSRREMTRRRTRAMDGWMALDGHRGTRDGS